MPPILRYILRRLLAIPATLLIVTAFLYAIAMMTPVRARAMLYFPNSNARLTEEQVERMIDNIIDQYGLDDPYPIQYVRWLGELVQGNWGWSPVARTPVLPYLLQRTPATAELTLYSVMVFIPLGLASGVIAARLRDGVVDHSFRLTAFVGAAVPPFILGLMMLSIFYVGLGWFPPGRMSIAEEAVVRSDAFHMYTGLLTLDGWLNGRPDISFDALRHLIMPVVALALTHWSTLGRVTRVVIIEELGKDYVMAARGRGLKERTVLWGHAMRNALVPALTSSALSIASLITGVYIVEVVFNLHGVSDLFAASVRTGMLDVPTGLGFGVYSVAMVSIALFVLDVIQALVDPRVRERIVES